MEKARASRRRRSPRTINDCPFGVADAEATIHAESEAEEAAGADEKTSEGDYTDLGYMFAAYVNEDSPIVEKILKEALKANFVDHFRGYQGDGDSVLRELFAIWSALQERGIKYSNVTTTPGKSKTVLSQHVRFVDESGANEQANCVDGSVLFCSVLRKLGLRSFLVTVPGHMYMGVYLSETGDERVALETTLLGVTVGKDVEEVEVVRDLSGVRASLDEEAAQSDAWKTFAVAVAVGTKDLVENAEKFEAENEPQYQITDVNGARNDGIMPISYQKTE